MTEAKPPEGFKITDRRSFTADGQLRADVVKDSSAQKAEPATSVPRQKTETKMGPKQQEAGLEPVDFGAFLLNLYMTALMHLGVGPESGSRPVPPDLAAANQMIQLIGMLQVKTKGNLDAQEEKLFDQILYELRLKYVEEVGKVNRGK